jgi:hypothetical protein
MQFVEIDAEGHARSAGPAPFLDYQPIAEPDRARIAPLLEAEWLKGDLESLALSYAVQNLVPAHFDRVRRRREEAEAIGKAGMVHYVSHPFQREPDFAVTSVNYDLKALLADAEAT